MSSSSWHRYPLPSLLPDYGRALSGTALCVTPLLWPLPVFVVALLGALALCFAIFALQTWRRQLTSLRADADNLECVLGHVGLRRYSWRELRGMSLAYFSVRGDGRNGWMELKLNFAGGTVRVDSRLDDFAGLVGVGLATARRLGVTLSPTTCRNLAEMGLEATPRGAAVNPDGLHD